MNAVDRKTLQEHYEKLVNDVKYYQVSTYLLSKFVLDLRMDAEIKSAKTEQEQMEKFLGILQTRGPESFKHFVASLQVAYPWLADSLVHDQAEDKENCQDAQRHCSKNKDDIPLTPTCDVSIAEFIPEVRRVLVKSPTVCRQWKTLANSMRLHHSTILDIEQANRNCTPNLLHEILSYWVEEFGQHKATFCTLIAILQAERMVFAADEVKKLWITNCPPT